MAPPKLTLQDIHLTFGGDPLLTGAELIVGERERLCLVGRNGCGKSTLLRIAAGMIEPDVGNRFLQPGSTVRYLPQEPDLSGHADVASYIAAGSAPGDDPNRVALLLQALGLTGDETPDRLSGGEARRAALARALAPQPNILLLDEPTNHLDLPAIEWLEAELLASRSALVLISHDRRFLERLTEATVWLDRGVTRRLDRGFGAFERWRDEVLEKEQQDRHKLDRKIVREQHWIRYGVTARRKRNQGRLKALEALRERKRTEKGPVGRVKLETAETAASGKMVIEAKSISKSYGANAIVDDFSVRVGRGDRVGLVGPNGAGKTTLLKMLIGELAPDAGQVRQGAGLEVVTLDQGREALDPACTLRDALTGGGGDMVPFQGAFRHVVSVMKDFLFVPEQAGTPIGRLSGGERGRLMLARALSKPSNLMVLDEPTNDLDLETLDLLQEVLADYAGTLLLVSHDRDFLDRVVTSVIASEGHGRWVEYAGGYSDMVAQRSGGEKDAGGERPAKSKPRRTDTPPRARPAKRKLSFKEKHALENLPGRMTDLESEIEALQSKLSDPEFFQKERDAFDRATERLKQAETELTSAEEEWLALELLREELDGA